MMDDDHKATVANVYEALHQVKDRESFIFFLKDSKSGLTGIYKSGVIYTGIKKASSVSTRSSAWITTDFVRYSPYFADAFRNDESV